MDPCWPRTIHLPLTASPCGRLSRPPSTISQYDFHSVVRPSSPWRLVGPYKLSFEPDGSPLFTSTPLVACWRYEPREHLRPLAKTRPLIPPSPLSDRVGYSDHVRFRGYFPVHCIPAYNLPVYASQWPLPEHHARLGTRLLARLCRGRHRRRQTSTRLQGATLIKPGVPISGTRLSDWLHRKAHGDKLTARGFGTVSNSPSPLDTAISGGACH
jgi:hypothetical protein